MIQAAWLAHVCFHRCAPTCVGNDYNWHLSRLRAAGRIQGWLHKSAIKAPQKQNHVVQCMPGLLDIGSHSLGRYVLLFPQETANASFVVVNDPSIYKAAGVKANPPAVAHRRIQGVKPKVLGLRFTMNAAPVTLYKHAARDAFKACTVPMLRKLTYKLHCELEGHRPKKEDELAQACISACLPELSAPEVQEIAKLRHKSRKDTQFESFAGTVADVANIEGAEKLFD
jgi:hypothetical protein